MARNDDMRRVEVGFSGGQAIAVRLSDEPYDDLRRPSRTASAGTRSRRSTAWSRSTSRQVVFVKLEAAEHRVGFSGL